eukprot:scaffold18066_cov42-Cyclotella_meneghiniana.AAC.10
MFSAAASLVAEDKVRWVLHHVQGLIAVTETPLVCSRPIGIPQCCETLLRMAANAYSLIPRGTCRATFFERGEEPGCGISLHPCGLPAVVEAYTRVGLIGVEEVDARRGGWSSGRGATRSA